MAELKKLPKIELDDFELPPLPAVPVKTTDAVPEMKTSPDIDKVIDSDLPPLPERAPENSLDTVDELEDDVIDASLPELPKKSLDDSLDAIADIPEDKELPESAAPSAPDEVDEIEVNDDDDFELPPVKAPAPKAEEDIVIEDTGRPSYDDAVAEAEEEFDFEDDYTIDLDNIDPASVGLSDVSALSDLRSSRETSARNLKEKIKMTDLAMELGDTPILDDLSDEYLPTEEKAVNLLEQEKLDDDGKRVLKQRLTEALQQRPEHFNQRQSNMMANKLLEEKKKKIAKKGFFISLAVILLGLVSAAISYMFLEWGGHNWFRLAAITTVIGSLMLLIKSKHAKIITQLVFFLGIVAYIVPGLGMYLLDPESLSDPDMSFKTTMFCVASAINMIAILILVKSEPLNLYYTAKFSKDNGRRRR